MPTAAIARTAFPCSGRNPRVTVVAHGDRPDSSTRTTGTVAPDAGSKHPSSSESSSAARTRARSWPRPRRCRCRVGPRRAVAVWALDVPLPCGPSTCRCRVGPRRAVAVWALDVPLPCGPSTRPSRRSAAGCVGGHFRAAVAVWALDAPFSEVRSRLCGWTLPCQWFGQLDDSDWSRRDNTRTGV
jgi:hypothetical protein